MTITPLQEQCELGQQELMRMNYVEAERILAAAEQQAWDARDFDTLSRLYMPLQETRRQRRQRCGEGVVCLDLIAENPNYQIDGPQIIENYPFGQLLVAGWGSIQPALAVRHLQQKQSLYVETFLAAVYPTPTGKIIAIVPLADTPLPQPHNQPPATLKQLLSPHCLILHEQEIPRGVRTGTSETYAEVMTLWERLHTPFLAAADAEPDPIRQLEAYRKTLRVDYACELAHQRLADAAKRLARQ